MHHPQNLFHGLFSLLVNTLSQYVFPSGDGSSISKCDLSDAVTKENIASSERESVKQQGRQTIDVLPDSVLLYIFGFYHRASLDYLNNTWPWPTLVHVCQKWRYIVFASPHYLDLRLLCTHTTPVRETLDVWPELPIIVNIWNDSRLIYPEDEGNIIAALEDHNRLCQISLSGLSTPLLGRLAPMMQGPFPKLTSLHLGSDGDIAEVPSDAFSNGFAPRLQRLWLIDISFQKLPDLLSSTPDLTELYLVGIPSSGYISPEVMTKCLSKLARLNCLRLEFHSPNPRPVRGIQGPPPLTRTTLPALTVFIFRGVSEYLDVLVAQIDAPRLENLYITFFNQLIFTIPHLQQFVGRTGNLQSPNRAAVLIDSAFVEIILYQPGTTPRSLTLRISCGKSDWQISSLVQVCGPFLPSLSSVEELEIRHFHYYRADWPADVDDDQWLEFFHPFTVVQILYVRRTVGPAVALALRNLTGERATEVLPALRDIFVEGRQPYSPMCAAMESFLTARRLSDHSDYPAL